MSLAVYFELVVVGEVDYSQERNIIVEEINLQFAIRNGEIVITLH